MDSMTKYCTCTHARLPVDARPDNTGKSNVPGGDTTSFVVSDIIQEAMRFANKESTHTRQVSIKDNRYHANHVCVSNIVANSYVFQETRENMVGVQRGQPSDELQPFLSLFLSRTLSM